MSKIICAMALVIITIIVFSIVIALPVMLLWNWLMPIVFELPKITFLQAIGLTFLSDLLFKSSMGKK